MSKNNKRRGLLAVELSRRTKVIIIAAVAAVILLCAVTAILIALVDSTKPKANVTPVTEEQKREAKIEESKSESDIINAAESAMDKNDTDKVDSIYKTALKDEADPTKKVKLTTDWSRVYLFASNYNQAIRIAKTAESLTTDKYLIANWLSQAYYTNRQYTLAAQYFTLAGKWSSSPNNIGGFTQDYYDQRAASATRLAGGSR